MTTKLSGILASVSVKATLVVICMLLPGQLHAGEAISELKAFPSAEGYGANAQGGRGGAVIQVTSLANDGAGSLRACIETPGPRVCVFRVSGTIELEQEIWVREPFLTIAGQTAPGDGIQLKNMPKAPSTRSPLEIITHDVVVRHLRVRPGSGAHPPSTDSIGLGEVKDVILDHVSLQWSLDENLGLEGRDVTVQHSILGEGLMPHSKGALACTEDATECANITFYGNLFAHNRDRNPNADTKKAPFDLINNVVYNPVSEFLEVHDYGGGTKINVVGNVFLPGPSTKKDKPALIYHTHSAEGQEGTSIYMRDNVVEGPLINDAGLSRIVDEPSVPFSVQPKKASDIYDIVLERAGAWPRDKVDERIVDDVKNRSGSLIVTPGQVGGWPELASDTPYPDEDMDGIDDRWELTHGLDSSNSKDRKRQDETGYTFLDIYLEELAQELVSAE